MIYKQKNRYILPCIYFWIVLQSSELVYSLILCINLKKNMQSSLPIYFVIDIWKLDIPSCYCYFCTKHNCRTEKIWLGLLKSSSSNYRGTRHNTHFLFQSLICLWKRGIWGYWCIDKIYMHDIEKFTYISMHCSKSLIEIRNNLFYANLQVEIK